MRAGFALLTPVLVALAACAPPMPTDSVAIESVGMRALQTRDGSALGRLNAWSQQGSAVAQRELALALLPDAHEQARAVKWLTRAAVGGDAEGAYLLGEAHRVGRAGLKPDAVAARPWLEMAAKRNHADAALSLARLWRNGESGPRDDVQAAHWLLASANGGNSQAMFLLSNAYAEGQGVAVDLVQARRWLEAAADHHFGPAMQAYALALESGDLGLDRDGEQARELLQEAREERRNRWNAR
jgi:TPR repeat protein